MTVQPAAAGEVYPASRASVPDVSASYWSVPVSTTLKPVRSPSPFMTSGPRSPEVYPVTIATCEANGSEGVEIFSP